MQLFAGNREEKRGAARSPVVNVYIPFAVTLLLLAGSVYLDITAPGHHWAQRFGAVMTVMGAYIMHFDDATRHTSSGKPVSYRLVSIYTQFSLPCIIVGTLLWGYGDLLL